MIDISSDSVGQLDSDACGSIKLCLTTCVGALGSLKVQTLVGKPIMSKDGPLGQDCILSRSKLSSDGSHGISELNTHEVDVRGPDTVQAFPSELNAHEVDVTGPDTVQAFNSSLKQNKSSCNTNESSMNTRRYLTRRSTLLAKQSQNSPQEALVSKDSSQEAATPPNLDIEAHRYSTKRSILLAKQPQSTAEVIVSEANQEAVMPSTSNIKAHRHPTRRNILLAKQPQPTVEEAMINTGANHEAATPSDSKIKLSRRISKSKDMHNSSTAKENGKNDENLNAKATISLKRKLRSHEKLDTQPLQKETFNDDDMALWLKGTQFENFCVSEDDIGNGVVARKTISGILQIFQIICTKLLEEQGAGSKCHGQGARADFMALKFLKNRFKCLNNSRKYLGAVPGVEIGDVFHYRVEMLVIRLHRNLQAGIGCVNHAKKVVAASIVSSGGYNNAVNSSGILIYSGSGGYPGFRSKKEKLSTDQKLEGGNLALKNSIEARTPVRVIYGLKEDEFTDIREVKGKKVAAYVYDGLYLVEKYWSELGSNGFSTLKFQLRRIPGQREIGIKVIAKSKFGEVRRGVCIEDISDGKESIPVLVVNTIDSELPRPFTYITSMIYPPQHKLAPPKGCDCKNGCSDSVKCACVIKNGGEIPFNREGAILAAKPLVYECGPSCKCPPSCQNRVSQLGIKFRLEVFKTKLMGWGVRSPTRIPSGSFICEYIGEMLEDTEADKRENDDYLFDIGNNYNDKALWEGLSYVPSLQKRRSGGEMDEEYTIDAANFANAGRFINHSCTPNLYAQNILYDHDEPGMPHVMLFATEDIPPFEELTYHYNYYIDRVQGPDGKIKKKDCYCGSIECTGRLY